MSYGPSRRKRRITKGRVLAVAGLAALVFLGYHLTRLLDGAVPSVGLKPEADAIGRATQITVRAADETWGVKRLQAVLVQGERTVVLGEVSHEATPWWNVSRDAVEASARLVVTAGSEAIDGLEEGEAVIRAVATNDSPAGFGSGRTATAEVALPVLLKPPRVEVLSGNHFIREGGAECARYRVSETARESGVRVGEHWFPGFPVPGGDDTDRFAMFAFPVGLDESTRVELVARDAALNERSVRLSVVVRPRAVRSVIMNVSDAFLERVLPPILERSPSVEGSGNLLADYLTVNGDLRRENALTLKELAAKSGPEPLWRGAFSQLRGSAVMASYADHRRYRYGGRIVDEQDHMGYDLAVTANYPVDASNSGIVAYAGFLGIYGNTVILDHGHGLMSLYSHLSSIGVEEGDRIEQGAVVGRSGATGLAGGDHLHFGVLLHGVAVDPTEWWDGRWIENRILACIDPDRRESAPDVSSPTDAS